MTKLILKTLFGLINIYQRVISPVLPARCRYYPTCSEYAKTALHWHRFPYSVLIAIKRIVRCHPFGGHGIDYVPLPLYQIQFILVDPKCPNGLCERGVYKDCSSYSARLNTVLNS